MELSDKTSLKNPPASRADFGLILLGGLALGGLILLSELAPGLWAGPLGWLLAPLRLLLGLAYLLYAPGYLLQAALFAHADDLDGVERAGLSLGLSVALVPLLALLLDRLPWGLRPWPIVIGQAGLVLALLAAAAVRRAMLPADLAYAPDVRPHPRRWWAGLEKNERRLYGLALGSLLLAGLLAAWVFLVPSPDEFMTEFYLLGKGGLAEDFPRQAAVGEPLAVTLGLANRERQAETYRVEVWAQDSWDETRRQQVAAAGPFGLDKGESLEQPLEWQMPWAGEDQQVEFLLYAGDQPEPYRHLRLWLNVSAPAP